MGDESTEETPGISAQRVRAVNRGEGAVYSGGGCTQWGESCKQG